MSTFVSNFPLIGIHWGEFLRAYRVFLSQPEAGIKHINAAQRYSNWDAWVRQRLEKQAKHLEKQPLRINLSELAELPADTLGGSYARHMLALGFDPDIFNNAFEDEDWLDQRAGVSHDLYHIVTGFDASPLGEYGLAAFAVVQYRDMLNAFILSFVPLSLMRPGWTMPLLRNLWRGFKIGRKCKPIIGYAFEQNWEKPLSQVRQELGVGSLYPQAQYA